MTAFSRRHILSFLATAASLPLLPKCVSAAPTAPFLEPFKGVFLTQSGFSGLTISAPSQGVHAMSWSFGSNTGPRFKVASMSRTGAITGKNKPIVTDSFAGTSATDVQNPDANGIAVWATSSEGPLKSEIRVRVMTAKGLLIGRSHRVDVDSPGDKSRVAAAVSGDFGLVLWSRVEEFGLFEPVGKPFARLFNIRTGKMAGPVVRPLPHAGATAIRIFSVLALPAGRGWAVSYEATGANGVSTSQHLQFLEPSGLPKGSPHVIPSVVNSFDDRDDRTANLVLTRFGGKTVVAVLSKATLDETDTQLRWHFYSPDQPGPVFVGDFIEPDSFSLSEPRWIKLDDGRLVVLAALNCKRRPVVPNLFALILTPAGKILKRHVLPIEAVDPSRFAAAANAGPNRLCLLFEENRLLRRRIMRSILHLA